MAQAKGSKAQLVVDFESAYKTAPGSSLAVKLPVNSCTVRSSRALNAAATITGRRDPVEPFDGNTDVSGEVVAPLDARALYYWLRGGFGAPTRSDVAAQTLDAGSARNAGSGLVGLPLTGHGYTAGTQVKIAGSTNYNGVHTLAASTSANELVIATTYVAETLAGDETVTPCIQVLLTAGAATNEGSGKVGLPSTGHGLPVGAEITVAGTTNYNATYTVARGTTANKLVVTATYQAETFAGDETVTAYFHSHEFVVGDSMPSLILEKGFTDIGQYALHAGCKLGSLKLEAGGDGELTVSMGVMGATETLSTSPYDASPVAVAIKRFNSFQASLSEGGVAMAAGTKASLDINFNLDGDQYVIGGGGVRGGLPEGVLAISGSLSALFEDTTLLDKAIGGTESSLSLAFVSGHHSLAIDVEELRYGRQSPGISGPKGILVELPWQGYYADGAAGSSVVFTLVNEIKTYA
jgi:hypothetical protein